MTKVVLDTAPQWTVYKTAHTIEVFLEWGYTPDDYGKIDASGSVIGKKVAGGTMSFDTVELRQTVNPRTRIRATIDWAFAEIEKLLSVPLPLESTEKPTLTIIEDVMKEVQ